MIRNVERGSILSRFFDPLRGGTQNTQLFGKNFLFGFSVHLERDVAAGQEPVLDGGLLDPQELLLPLVDLLRGRGDVCGG